LLIYRAPHISCIELIQKFRVTFGVELPLNRGLNLVNITVKFIFMETESS